MIEFYAGIGGFHYALLEAGVDATVVVSIDINTNTNAVYQHNFPNTRHSNWNICGISAEDLDRFCPDVFVLSPPCQPFTRQGLRRDNVDRRTDSFFHLMETMTELKHPPKYILVENVQGFEVSNTREHFVGVLKQVGYDFQEFLLSPRQFGVPNSRLRYYLVARKNESLPFPLRGLEQPCTDAVPLLKIVSELKLGRASAVATSSKFLSSVSSPKPVSHDQLQPESVRLSSQPRFPVEHGSTCTIKSKESIPKEVTPSDSTSGGGEDDIPVLPTSTLATTTADKGSVNVAIGASQVLPLCDVGATATAVLQPISHYLEPLTDADLQRHLVPDKILKKYAIALDIVQPTSTQSCCFTKAYSKYAVGTGSVLQHAPSQDLDKAFQEFSALQKAGEVDASLHTLLPLKLRYFTPREVANLMCFPPSFSFPPELSLRQCYQVLGNSLNVRVVSVLMRYLFCSS